MRRWRKPIINSALRMRNGIGVAGIKIKWRRSLAALASLGGISSSGGGSALPASHRKWLFAAHQSKLGSYAATAKKNSLENNQLIVARRLAGVPRNTKNKSHRKRGGGGIGGANQRQQLRSKKAAEKIGAGRRDVAASAAKVSAKYGIGRKWHLRHP